METIYNILTSTATSGLLIWLFKHYIERKFSRRIQKEKIELEGALKKEVEAYLGEVAAERKFKYEARKRIYKLISPLNFQISIACKDISGRIFRYGTKASYSLNAKKYYGQSTMYRLLKPLALLEIAEKNISFFDFSVDPTAINLLKLRMSLLRVLSSSSLVFNHPAADWSDEIEHIFFDNISKAARKLIRKEGELDIVMSFDEFQDSIELPDFQIKLNSFINIFNNFTIEKKPLFWIRFIAFGYVCSEYSKVCAQKIGLKVEDYDIYSLLKASKDSYIIDNSQDFEITIKKITDNNIL